MRALRLGSFVGVSPARSSPASKRASKAATYVFRRPLRKGLLRPRAHGESYQGHEALHALRPHLLPPLGGQSVPPVASHGAYWLLHELRGAAPKRSIWRTATFETIRCTFLKIAVRIQELKTRIKMALPSAYPHVQALTALATSIAVLAP